MRGTKPNTHPTQHVTFPFAKVTLYHNYMVSVINEGETVTVEHNEELVNLSQSFYAGRPFGYISYRLNSYAVDPKTYIETSKIENLAGFAVVTDEKLKLDNTQVEKLFLKKPVSVFNSVDDAVVWIEAIIAQMR